MDVNRDISPLNSADLEVQELERRLELAASAAALWDPVCCMNYTDGPESPHQTEL